MFFAAWGGYFIWDRYFKYDPVKVYQEAERKYIEAMTADTYGGKTPQETLDMFVEALRAEDVELASKYFMLDTDLSAENIENYLTHKSQLAQLEDARNKLQEIADVISGAVLSTDQPSWDENLVWYVVYEKKGDLEADISLRFNKYAQVWKIESL